MESYPGRSDLNPPIPPPRHNTFTATDFNLISMVSYDNPVDYALTHKPVTMIPSALLAIITKQDEWGVNVNL